MTSGRIHDYKVKEWFYGHMKCVEDDAINRQPPLICIHDDDGWWAIMRFIMNITEFYLFILVILLVI